MNKILNSFTDYSNVFLNGMFDQLYVIMYIYKAFITNNTTVTEY